MQSPTADIPSSIIDKYVSPAAEPDSTLRDLVVGSFLSSRKGEVIFFPHRSIQEYLVAEELILRMQKEPKVAIEFTVGKTCTDELEAFAVQMVSDIGSIKRKGERSNKKTQRTRSFGSFEEVQELSEFSRLVCNGDPILNRRIVRILSADYIVLSNLFNIGRREGQTAAHIVVALHWLMNPTEGSSEVREVEDSIISEVRRKFYFESYSLFVSLVLSAVKGDSGPVWQYFVEGGESVADEFNINLIKYHHKSGNLDLSALYKSISGDVRATGVVEDWVLGDSFRLEGKELPQRIYDPQKELYEIIWGKQVERRARERSGYNNPVGRR